MIFITIAKTNGSRNTFSAKEGDKIEFKYNTNSSSSFLSLNKIELHQITFYTNNVLYKITNSNNTVIYFTGDKIVTIIDNPNY